MLGDDLEAMRESLQTHFEFLDVVIHLIEAGVVVGELQLVGTNGGDGRSEGGKCERTHLRVIRLNFY